MAEMRLHKFLAHAGVASRRASEDLIRAGRVTVDGQVVTDMGVRIDPATARVTVDGRPVQAAERLVYLALNKPRGYVTTAGEDPFGRPTVMELVPRRERVYPVGRLDADTEGLLILTNDGELAHRMMHPRYYVQKEYIAKVRGVPDQAALRQLREGVPTRFQPEPARPHRVELIEPLEGDAALVRVVIHEGAKHQVRDMLEAVGHPVLSLRRTRVGPIFLGELRRGEVRELTPAEVAELRQMVRLPAEPGAEAPARPRPAGRLRRPEGGKPRPEPIWRRRTAGEPAQEPPAGAPPAAPAAPRAPAPQVPPPRRPRAPWWAAELDEHPPRVRTWHAPEARPEPGPRERPERPERPAARWEGAPGRPERPVRPPRWREGEGGERPPRWREGEGGARPPRRPAGERPAARWEESGPGEHRERAKWPPRTEKGYRAPGQAPGGPGRPPERGDRGERPWRGPDERWEAGGPPRREPPRWEERPGGSGRRPGAAAEWRERRPSGDEAAEWRERRSPGGAPPRGQRPSGPAGPPRRREFDREWSGGERGDEERAGGRWTRPPGEPGPERFRPGPRGERPPGGRPGGARPFQPGGERPFRPGGERPFRPGGGRPRPPGPGGPRRPGGGPRPNRGGPPRGGGR
jgi:23S rRNA pseudouridine2605 synthase